MADVQFAYKNNAIRFKKIVVGQLGSGMDVTVGTQYTVCTIPKGVMVTSVMLYAKGLTTGQSVPVDVSFSTPSISNINALVVPVAGVVDTLPAGAIIPEDTQVDIAVQADIPAGVDIFVGVEFVEFDISSEQRVRAKVV